MIIIINKCSYHSLNLTNNYEIKIFLGYFLEDIYKLNLAYLNILIIILIYHKSLKLFSPLDLFKTS
jgi:hypothetical protein